MNVREYFIHDVLEGAEYGLTENLLDHAEPFGPPVSNVGPSSSSPTRSNPPSTYPAGSSDRTMYPFIIQNTGNPFPPQDRQPDDQRTGRAVLTPNPNEETRRPVQFEDSGIRFSTDEERQPDLPRLPNDVPPTYTHN